MLNKYLFGLLVNTTAIFASISSDVVAYEDIYDFRSELNQIAWDIDCSFRECCIQEDIYANKDTEENAWILEQEYEDSRTKAIGEAIGDCVAGKNEFAKKAPEDIITFDETEPKDYEPEHWNAVILYNYIHEAINGEWLPEDEDKYKELVYNVDKLLGNKLLGNKLSTLKAHYGTQYNGAIDNAVKEIQEYVKALKLNEELYEFRQSKLKYDNDQDKHIVNIAPYVNKDSNIEELKFDYAFFKSESKDQRQEYYPTFWCQKTAINSAVLTIDQLQIKHSHWDEQEKDWKDDRTYRVNSADLSTEGRWLLNRLTGLIYIPHVLPYEENADAENEWHAIFEELDNEDGNYTQKKYNNKADNENKKETSRWGNWCPLQ